jgi:hypothetical protein
MARPETIKDVKERTISVGRIEVNKFLTNPSLLKAYIAFGEAVEKNHGELVDSGYNGVEFKLLRTEEQLHDQLRSEQYQWDDSHKLYNRAVMRYHEDVEAPKDYQQDRIKEWAEQEGLPDPYAMLSDDFDDETLDRIRQEMGLEA